MKNSDKQTDYWKPCRPGTIRKVSDSSFSRSRRKFILQATMGGIVAGLGVFSSMFIMNHHKRRLEQSLAADENSSNARTTVTQIRLSCSDIIEQMDEFVLISKIAPPQLSPDQKLLKAEFNQHLTVCDTCVHLVEEALNA